MAKDNSGEKPATPFTTALGSEGTGSAYIVMMLRKAGKKDTVPEGEAVLTGWAILVASSLATAVSMFSTINAKDIPLEGARWTPIKNGSRGELNNGISVQILTAPMYIDNEIYPKEPLVQGSYVM